jgi:hypothetical protein
MLSATGSTLSRQPGDQKFEPGLCSHLDCLEMTRQTKFLTVLVTFIVLYLSFAFDLPSTESVLDPAIKAQLVPVVSTQ